jgi:aspartate 1-decarboxylase
MMMVEVLHAKLHRLRITGLELNYVGSITLDEALLDASGILPNQKVQIVNVNNGNRIETYVIKGERGSGICELNGPAARTAALGDVVIVIAYASMPYEEAKVYEPVVVFPDANNQLPA